MARLDRSHEDRGQQGAPIRLHPSASQTSQSGLPLPDVTLGLLQHLAERFPDKLPPVGTPHDDILIRQGEQKVITHLRQLWEDKQEEDARNVPINTRSAAAGGPDPSASAATG